MSAQNPDTPAPSGSTPKAIGSLAKKQSDVTRQGTQKLKFVPTLPQRRKKEEVKPEPTTPAIPAASADRARGRGRGRGRGDARGRGGGRGAAPPVVEMTASGPFAMGPALAGSSARRSTPRSNFAPSIPSVSGSGAASGANLSRSAAPSLKKEADPSGKGKGKEEKSPDDEEVYSDPDEGVEIVDMNHVREMDWMAPESLRKERVLKKVKKEEPTVAAATGEVDLSNALDLSESEEEEELEDIIEDFAFQANVDTDPSLREDRLYFFQFPVPFPTFVSKKSTGTEDVPMVDGTTKKVSFAPETKPAAASASSRTASAVPSEPQKAEHLDGVIGKLEVYRSGAVKIRLENGILLDVNAATQPSFLQQAVHLDTMEKRLSVLGEVNKQFIVSPHVETLLAAMEQADKASPTIAGEEGLVKMDTS